MSNRHHTVMKRCPLTQNVYSTSVHLGQFGSGVRARLRNTLLRQDYAILPPRAPSIRVRERLVIRWNWCISIDLRAT